MGKGPPPSPHFIQLIPCPGKVLISPFPQSLGYTSRMPSGKNNLPGRTIFVGIPQWFEQGKYMAKGKVNQEKTLTYFLKLDNR